MLFALASASIFSAIAFYLYGALGKELAARNEEHLTSMTELVRHVLDETPSVDQLLANPGLVTHLLVGHHDLRLGVYSPDGRPYLFSTDTPLPNKVWAYVREPQAQSITLGIWHDTSNSAYRLAAARLASDKPGLRDATVLLALDVTQEFRVLRTFGNSLFAAMAAGLFVAAILCFLIASRGLRPIVRVAESARRITASQLQERLDPSGVPEELAALVDSFNTMLARLEDSFRRLSDFSADLAHELRTPLTNILGKSQVLLSRARTIDEYREALESNVEDVEHLSKLTSDMLFLAQADRAEAALNSDEFELGTEIRRLTEYFGFACDERGIRINVSGEANVRGDRTMIRRAVGNLLSNALRHSPDGECVEVLVDQRDQTVRVSVLDRGTGIPLEHQARIFDRFYRADASRTRQSGGTGLGLAIVRSIAKLHGGDVSITSVPGERTAFTIILPATLRQSAVMAAA